MERSHQELYGSVGGEYVTTPEGYERFLIDHSLLSPLEPLIDGCEKLGPSSHAQ